MGLKINILKMITDSERFTSAETNILSGKDQQIR